MSSDSNKSEIRLKDVEIRILDKRGYKIGGRLSGGSFSSVCKATYNGSKQMAVKVIDVEKTTPDYRFKFLPRELYTIRKLKHPYIIEVHEIFTVENKVFVFMELAEGGDLLDLIHGNGALPESEAKVLYRQISGGLKYIHSTGIAHRDIKCENILLNKTRDIAKLTDFGFARTCYDNTTGKRLLCDTYCGSRAYVAPEVLRAQPYNAMLSDVWSIGVVLFVLLNNELPFKGSNLKQILDKQTKKEFEFIKKISDIGKDLIKKQLEPNLSFRYDMNKVCGHKWLKS